MSRPPIYDDPKALQSKAEEYFDSLLAHNDDGSVNTLRSTAPTITGLCLYLGFCSRQSFYDYGVKKEFSYTIKRLHMMIELAYEQCLKSGQVAGVIFALKNLGWSDKQEIEQTGQTVVSMPTITYNGKELEFNIGHKVRTSGDHESAGEVDAHSK